VDKGGRFTRMSKEERCRRGTIVPLTDNLAGNSINWGGKKVSSKKERT